MVMLHIELKGITKCGNMVVKNLPKDPPPAPHNPRGWCQKVKIQLVEIKVMLHIKLKVITNAATWKQISCPQTPPPWTLIMGSIGQNSTFSDHGHVKGILEMQQHGSKYFACSSPLPHDPRGWGQNSTVSEHIKLKGITNAATWNQIFCLQTPPPPPHRP